MNQKKNNDLRLRCLKCKYRWEPRKADVRICPRCKSARWNDPQVKKWKPGSRGEKENV